MATNAVVKQLPLPHLSAFISIYRATDNASMPYLNLVVYGIEGGKENAVTRLEKLFAEWREQNTANRSSQRFIVP